MVKRLLVVACCIAIASCGASRQKSSEAGAPAAAPEAGTAGAEVMPATPRAQIEDLDRQIAADRAQLGLDEPTDAMVQGAPAAPMSVAPASEDPTCRPAATDTCKTSCSLSDSICGNAEKICKLAQDMAGDDWAANKCAKANQTCEASRAKCCGCQ